MNKHKKLVLQVLLDFKGDDHARAKAAFARLSEKQMDEQWGMSGKTPRQILADYEERNREIDEAIEWVKSK